MSESQCYLSLLPERGCIKFAVGFQKVKFIRQMKSVQPLLLESEAPPQVFGQLSSHTTFFIRIGRQAPTQGLIEQMAM
jgi:hypothetical protein